MALTFKYFIKQGSIIFVILLIALFYAYGAKAWTAPTGVPPNNDALAPLTVDTVAQVKAGGLWLTSLIASLSLCLGTDCRSTWPSVVTTGASRIYCFAWEQTSGVIWNQDAALLAEVNTRPKSASCPAYTHLALHGVDYYYNYGNDWQNNQNENFSVYANYSTNVISCITQGGPAMSHMGGVGLCLPGGNAYQTVTYNLVNNLHSNIDCGLAGGTVVVAGGVNVCQFNSSCPGGWVLYNNWTTTTSVSCGCTTGGHTWQSKAVESCSFCTGYDRYGNCLNGGGCSATVNQAGCY